MSMRIPALFAALLLVTTTAGAGPYTDDLSKCLVASSTEADRVALVRWIFISMAAHPDVSSISSAKPADVETANAEMGRLVMKLLTDTCREKVQVATKYEGLAALQGSFQVLGTVATSELMTNPAVQGRLAGFMKHVDTNALKAATTESAPKAAN